MYVFRLTVRVAASDTLAFGAHAVAVPIRACRDVFGAMAGFGFTSRSRNAAFA